MRDSVFLRPWKYMGGLGHWAASTPVSRWGLGIATPQRPSAHQLRTAGTKLFNKDEAIRSTRRKWGACPHQLCRLPQAYRWGDLRRAGGELRRSVAEFDPPQLSAPWRAGCWPQPENQSSAPDSHVLDQIYRFELVSRITRVGSRTVSASPAGSYRPRLQTFRK